MFVRDRVVVVLRSMTIVSAVHAFNFLLFPDKVSSGAYKWATDIVPPRVYGLMFLWVTLTYSTSYFLKVIPKWLLTLWRISLYIHGLVYSTIALSILSLILTDHLWSASSGAVMWGFIAAIAMWLLSQKSLVE